MPIQNKTDNKGNFYQFGDTGKKYYYKSYSKRSNDLAYNKCLKQAKAIEWSKHKEGSGLLDFFNLKSSAPNQVKKYLAENGDKPISKIEVKRSPIAKPIQKVLNVVSFGRLKKKTEELGYDSIYHLYMVIFFQDQRIDPVRIDKNEIVQINNGDLSGTDQMTVLIPPNTQLSLNQMFNNAEKVVGHTLWDYSASVNNCQKFICDMLQYSGLLTPILQQFIMQNAKAFLGALPKGTNKVFNGLTNLAGWFRTKILGQGLVKKKVIKKKVTKKKVTKKIQPLTIRL